MAQQLRQRIIRAEGASQNGFENLGLFASGVVAANVAGVAPADAVCVGDTLPTDVVGARNAGMRVAWLQRPDRPEPRNAGWGTPLHDPGVRIVAGLDAVAGWL